jgi:hypothetical protein
MKRILYYTHNSLPLEMEEYFQRKLLEAASDIPIVSVMKKPRSVFAANFASVNLIDENPQCDWPSIRRQMKMGLETMDASDTVYLAEHDVLYPASYYENEPPDERTFLKNGNLYFLTRRGYVGPYNCWIHSQTIGAASLFMHCIEEDFRDKPFKTQNGYTLTLFNAQDPSLDVRHGKNWTGDRTARNGRYLPSVPYWGAWREVGADIPGFELEPHRT